MTTLFTRVNILEMQSSLLKAVYPIPHCIAHATGPHLSRPCRRPGPDESLNSARTVFGVTS